MTETMWRKEIKFEHGLMLGLTVASAVFLFFVPTEHDKTLPKLKGELREIETSSAGWAKGFLAGCGTPCRIKNNYGGKLSDFKALADEILASDRVILIEGDCVSGCATMTDLARSKIVIGRDVRFGFHNSSLERPQPLSADIDAWVQAHGGYPTFASEKTSSMDFDAARRFFTPTFDWYREPRRMDAPWHWPGDPIGVREATAGLPAFVMPSPRSSLVQVSLRGTVR